MTGKNRWLVTGASGMLGANAVLWLADRGADVTAVGRFTAHAPRTTLVNVRLERPQERTDLIASTNPEVVFHAAAVSTLEQCEKDPELAQEVNVRASEDLARQSLMSGAKFVFISTDAVFDGSQGNYQESDPVSPASVYGRTKADAELAVLEANPSSLILRVNFHGWSPSGRRSLSEFFFNRLSEGNATPGFTDVVVSTMYAGDLVSAAIELVGADSSGIVHLASREAISKYSFGQKVARRFGWDPDLVLASSSRAHLTVARGSALDLDVSLATKIIGRPLPAQDDSLDALFADFENGFRARLREAMPSQEETA